MLFANYANIHLFTLNSITLALLSTLHFAGFQCAGADIYALRFTIDQNPNFLDVHTPGSFRFVVRMGNIVASGWALAGNITFASHESHTSLVPKHT